MNAINDLSPTFTLAAPVRRIRPMRHLIRDVGHERTGGSHAVILLVSRRSGTAAYGRGGRVSSFEFRTHASSVGQPFIQSRQWISTKVGFTKPDKKN
jgi:hypothetical protein